MLSPREIKQQNYTTGYVLKYSVDSSQVEKKQIIQVILRGYMNYSLDSQPKTLYRRPPINKGGERRLGNGNARYQAHTQKKKKRNRLRHPYMKVR